MSGDVAGTALAVGLGAARTVPVTWLVPALGGPRLPAMARLAFGLLLATLAAPAVRRAGRELPGGAPSGLAGRADLARGRVGGRGVVGAPRRGGAGAGRAR